MEREFLPWLADVEDTVPALTTVYVPGEPLRAEDLPPLRRIEVRCFAALLGAPPDEIDVEVTYRDVEVTCTRCAGSVSHARSR